MTLVYIASPYTIGSKSDNVYRQIRCASALIDLGYCPIAPLLSHYIDNLYPKNYETWMQLDFELISRCDILLRLSGQSAGADREVNYAEALKIPVVYSIEELQEITK